MHTRSEMQKDEWAIDVMDAALALACEDDSIHGRSVVKLPTGAYSKACESQGFAMLSASLTAAERPSMKLYIFRIVIS